MRTTTQQNLVTAKKLLRDGRYNDVHEYLSKLETDRWERPELGEYYLLLAESLLFSGEYHHDYADRAISIFKTSSLHHQFAQAKYLKGWQLQSLGRLLDAKETMMEAYSAFLRVDDFNWAARILNRIAFICVLSGQLDQAGRNLEKCLDCYRQADNTRQYLVSRNNLALVYLLSGKLTKALKLYRQGNPDKDQLSPKNKCVFQLGYAMTTAVKGEFRKAKKFFDEAETMTDVNPHEEALYYEYRAWMFLLAEEYSQANKDLKKGLELSLKIASKSTLVSQLKRLYGDLYVALEKFDLAEKYAGEALELAQEINEPIEVAACWRILARVENNRGNTNKALEYFKKAIDQFRLIGSAYEHAMTCYQAATSGLYFNGERTAMLYIAREYFESESVQFFIDKIDKALRKRVAEGPDPTRIKPDSNGGPVIITVNENMKKLLAYARQIAVSEMNVMLTGETGTGKDLLAHYIHYHSGLKGRFVTVNAAAIPDSMVESELFGFSKGAFTGADREKPGLFEMADGGTFYLNEIGDTSREFQAKLLEVLETRQHDEVRYVRRLGENKPRPVKFRLIAATNHDLKDEIGRGRFRLDLYHRINEIPIKLPSLSDRQDDIHQLVAFFLKLCGMNPSKNGRRELQHLSSILSQRGWEGNIRQLRSEIRHLYLAANGDLKEMIKNLVGGDAKTEAAQLEEILRLTNWNRSRAAEILGVSEGTIRHRIKKFGISAN